FPIFRMHCATTHMILNEPQSFPLDQIVGDRAEAFRSLYRPVAEPDIKHRERAARLPPLPGESVAAEVRVRAFDPRAVKRSPAFADNPAHEAHDRAGKTHSHPGRVFGPRHVDCARFAPARDALRVLVRSGTIADVPSGGRRRAWLRCRSSEAGYAE